MTLARVARRREYTYAGAHTYDSALLTLCVTHREDYTLSEASFFPLLCLLRTYSREYAALEYSPRKKGAELVA